MSRAVEAFYPSAAERIKGRRRIELEEEISRAISISNALAIQEQGWSKRSEKPHGPLYNGWIAELQTSARRAADLSFELDCIETASKLHLTEKFKGNEISGMIEGKEVRISMNWVWGNDGMEIFFHGEADGVPLLSEEISNVYNKVGVRLYEIDNLAASIASPKYDNSEDSWR